MKLYDVVIIGAGVSGIFAAMQLAPSGRSILMIDAGKSLTERLKVLGHDIASNQAHERYYGFGGLGLSEGKYNYTNDFGGDLDRKIGSEQSLHYQLKVDQLLCQYGAQSKTLYTTFDPVLAERAKRAHFKLLTTQTRHLGTGLAKTILQAFAHYLDSRIEFMFNSQVKHINKTKQGLVLSLSNQTMINAKKVVIAVGRSGIDWLEPIAQQLKLSYDNTRLDLGFRIEMHGTQLDKLLQTTRETKLHYQTSTYQATTYCMNPQGRVIPKYQAGLVMPDGQNSGEIGPSSNLNFTLFIPKWFDTHQEADHYLHQVISTINQQQGIIAAQRLGDIDSHFSQRHQLIEPTLKQAIFTDLATITPKHYLANTCDFLGALETLLAEPIDGNTILYAMDSKAYAPVINTDHHFLTAVEHLYLIGDCSGVTSSLSQAAASGLYVADHINQTLT